MNPPLRVTPEVRAALDEHRPVVALETTLISHGLPRPENLETARALEGIVRDRGAVPATIGLADGQVHIGLDDDLLTRFADDDGVRKVSRRDLASALAQGLLGATTVAATLICAQAAGLLVMATGGIGGVHRGGQNSLDISADLAELGRSKLGVVCAGAKGILDLPRTLEVLETLGVPVVGYGTKRFPAFWCADSGLDLVDRVDTPQEAARLLRSKWALGIEGAVLFANPPPAEAALARSLVETHLARAMELAEAQAISGKDVTPFLLRKLAELSHGETLRTNLALLENNAALAADIAVALTAGTQD
jgi:pseudouridine-5'-phosphate glycosidase